MIDNLVAMYLKGAITADHLVVQSLQMVDAAAPELVLGSLPPEVRHRVLEFTRKYRPGAMVSNYGSVPSAEQVAAAKGWLEKERTGPPQPVWSAAGSEEHRDSA
jgi:hypothetical protein